jgi:predicted metal-binding protein
MARQRCNFYGKFFLKPRDISKASLKDLRRFVKRYRVSELVLKEKHRAVQ